MKAGWKQQALSWEKEQRWSDLSLIFHFKAAEVWVLLLDPSQGKLLSIFPRR